MAVKKRKLPPLLAAKSVVRKSKSAKSLTVRERDYVAKALVGEADAENQMMESPLVQETIVEILGNLGVDNTYVAKHIKDGMEGNKLFGKEAVEAPDWANRHKYLGTLLELAKLKQDGSQVRTPTVHVHYRSRVRGEIEPIDVTPPQASKAQRRLLAARPTNRKGA